MAHPLLIYRKCRKKGRGSGGRGWSTESLMATAAGRKEYPLSLGCEMWGLLFAFKEERFLGWEQEFSFQGTNVT